VIGIPRGGLKHIRPDRNIGRWSRRRTPVVKRRAPVPMTEHRKARRGGGPGTERTLISVKAKMYRLGLSVGMLAVLVEALGAGLKWG